MSTPTERVEMWVQNGEYLAFWDGRTIHGNVWRHDMNHARMMAERGDKLNNTHTTVKFGRVEFVEEKDSQRGCDCGSGKQHRHCCGHEFPSA